MRLNPTLELIREQADTLKNGNPLLAMQTARKMGENTLAYLTDVENRLQVLEKSNDNA